MTFRAALFGKLNIGIGFFALSAFLTYPLMLGENKLPYGLYIPGIDFLASPCYEISYLVELGVTIINVFLYMPFINMFTGFVVFGITMLRILGDKIRSIAEPFDGTEDSSPNNELIKRRFRLYIEYHKRIIRYVTELNEIVSTAFLVELILFGMLLCVLLFFVQLVDKTSLRLLGVTFIFIILSQLFVLYWLSNELIEEVRRLSQIMLANRLKEVLAEYVARACDL